MNYTAPVLLLLAAVTLTAQTIPEGLGKGWSGEFTHATNQLLALAEATPADKFSYRPAPGVRSTSEVYMHVAVGNYYLLSQAGAKPGAHWPDKIEADTEKKIKDKADVIRWLKDSFAAVKAAEPALDRSKKVTFFGQQTTVDGILLRILVHNHEHMGQAIAYARMSGVVPPWSK